MLSLHTYLIPAYRHRVFAVTLGLFALLNAILGIIYGDNVQLWAMVGVFLACIPYGALCKHLSIRTGEIVLHLFNLLALGIVNWSLSSGAAVALYIAFGLSTMTFSSKNIIGYAIVFVGAIVMYLVDHSPGSLALVPEDVGFIGNLVLFGMLGYRFVGSDRLKAARDFKKLQCTQIELTDEEKNLKETHQELMLNNQKIYNQNITLQKALVNEEVITKALATKRKDEHSLVQAIHHDLREPLRSIISFTQLLRRNLVKHNVATSSTDDYLNFAQDAGSRMVNMLDDLLHYSKTSKNVDLVSVDLNLIINNVKANLEDLIERKSAIIECENLPRILGRQTRLIQLFQNFIGNSLKYSRPGVPPFVKITADIIQDHLSIRISDNGIGIAPSELSQIFKLYSRVGNTTAVEGSGVGLSLCKAIISEHGGNVRVTSILGECTTFIIDGLQIATVDSNQIEEPSITKHAVS